MYTYSINNEYACQYPVQCEHLLLFCEVQVGILKERGM